MNNKQLNKLKNSLAIKCVAKIVLYSIVVIAIFRIIIDGLYNDELAKDMSEYSVDIYHWCVMNKTLLMGFSYIIISTITSFFVIRNSNNNMVEVISATDKIMKEPEQDIKLSNDLLILENRLNNIRADLVKNKNKVKEEVQKKNDLIMYMAHDLKTPLTSVIGYLSLLTQEKYISKEMQEKYIKVAFDKSLRLEELINQFFEITRYDLKEIPITKNKIDLSFLMEQLVDEFYPMLQKRGLKCIINKPEHIFLLGDGDKLARAFGNLIRNAISYSYENTSIEIEMKQHENKVNIVFRNKGDKIPKYKLDKIFDKFYRADESRATATGGTGLGLAITKEIIELHGGNIFVKNENEYIEFYIELESSDES